MEKARTLFNVVVLFVLVLFGSVVPASAQDPQGYGGVVQTVVVSVSAAVGAVVALLTFWSKFDGKVDKLGEKIDAAKKELKDDARDAHAVIGTNISRVEAKVDETNIFLRNRYAAEASRRGRPSENAQD